MKMIIFTHGCDTPGIGSLITKKLLENNLKTNDFKIISLNGFFSLMVSVESENYIDKSELEEDLKRTLREFKIEIKVYGDSLPSECADRQNDDWIPYKVNLICNNQTEALYYFMKETLNFNINISTVNCSNVSDSDEETHEIQIQIQVPTYVSIDELKNSLQDLARSINVVIDIDAIDNLGISID